MTEPIKMPFRVWTTRKPLVGGLASPRGKASFWGVTLRHSQICSWSIFSTVFARGSSDAASDNSVAICYSTGFCSKSPHNRDHITESLAY